MRVELATISRYVVFSALDHGDASNICAQERIDLSSKPAADDPVASAYSESSGKRKRLGSIFGASDKEQR